MRPNASNNNPEQQHRIRANKFTGLPSGRVLKMNQSRSGTFRDTLFRPVRGLKICFKNISGLA
jgi:hypothetical protein